MSGRIAGICPLWNYSEGVGPSWGGGYGWPQSPWHRYELGVGKRAGGSTHPTPDTGLGLGLYLACGHICTTFDCHCHTADGREVNALRRSWALFFLYECVHFCTQTRNLSRYSVSIGLWAYSEMFSCTCICRTNFCDQIKPKETNKYTAWSYVKQVAKELANLVWRYCRT